MPENVRHDPFLYARRILCAGNSPPHMDYRLTVIFLLRDGTRYSLLLGEPVAFRPVRSYLRP